MRLCKRDTMKDAPGFTSNVYSIDYRIIHKPVGRKIRPAIEDRTVKSNWMKAAALGSNVCLWDGEML